MGRIRNRIVNTLGIAPRTAKTAWRTTIDTTKSALNLVLDPFIGLWKTWSDIKQAIHKSFTEWRWYQKLRKVPTSLALSPFMAVEWVAETLRWTWVNACSSVRDIIWNTLTNEWTAIKMMWKWEKFDFSTEKLEFKGISPRNRLAGLFKPKTDIDVERDVLKDKKKDLKEQEKKVKELREKENARIKSEEEKLKKEKENWQSDKQKEEEKLRKEKEIRLNSKKSEEDKYTQTLNQQKESFNKEKEELNKRIAILEQEKKELQSTLKNSENGEKKAETIKLNPKVEKKENINESKEPKVVKLDPKQNWKVEKKPDSKESWNNNETSEFKQAA